MDPFCRIVSHVDERAIAARQSRSLTVTTVDRFINLRVYHGRAYRSVERRRNYPLVFADP